MAMAAMGLPAFGLVESSRPQVGKVPGYAGFPAKYTGLLLDANLPSEAMGKAKIAACTAAVNEVFA
jgi:hypothetical protein